MNAAGYVVPAVLRGAMFVPGQAERAVASPPGLPGCVQGRGPAGARAPGAAQRLPVHPAPGPVLDARAGRAYPPPGRRTARPREADPGGYRHAGGGGRHPDARRAALAGRCRAVEAGGLLDLSATVSVRTPGHPGRGHLPGWHLWYRADPGRPVRMGSLARCHAVELRARGALPGSPGYVVWSAPGQLPVLPPWIRGLAGPPSVPVARTGTGHGSAGGQARLHGIIGRLLAARRGERNRLLFWASLRVGELVADGDLDAGAAGQAPAGPTPPRRSGWSGRTGSGRSRPRSGQDSSAPGVAYDPPR